MAAERGAGREALRVRPGKRRPEPEPERQLEPEPVKSSLLCNPAPNHNDDSDSGLSDSKESAFSGLENSGSDSSEDTEDKEDGSNCDKDDGSTEETSKEQAQAPASRPRQRWRECRAGTSMQKTALMRRTSGTRWATCLEWYEDFPHVGYDLDGRRIYKPLRTRDELDDPDFWRIVKDRMTGQDLRLTDEQVALLQRLQRASLEIGDIMIHPVTNRPEDNRSFIPSLVEKEKVSRMVHAIKMGWIQPRRSRDSIPRFYDLWAQEDPNTVLGRHKMHVPAPKLALPGHTESYGKPVTQMTWHRRGDYLAVVLATPGHTQVLIHQLSQRRSQSPFRSSPGQVHAAPESTTCCARSSPKKLMPNCKWVSSLAVHPAGNIISGSYDSKLAWFDLDLSTKPYKVLRHHRKALWAVTSHPRYPFFALGSEDRSVIICHGMVYDDLLQNPLLVPVKVLKGHGLTRDLGVLYVVFHPTQPRVFSSGSDGAVRLFT
ncbi:Ribosome biogenesis protein BOP1 [Sciurus carolinensis]|uniref:Ribosome biogenesis protein BOP1 n=1 Tax=Sciurus carolinensis TaxID=30640 RepID=A0AA41MFQ0_SCICA|nr:Ribosome biogenesis protein BOP1 [Sciurus carolinensis]